MLDRTTKALCGWIVFADCICLNNTFSHGTINIHDVDLALWLHNTTEASSRRTGTKTDIFFDAAMKTEIFFS